ncbi:CRISPR-associated endonuclease Cas1 [Thermoproteota archaeon]
MNPLHLSGYGVKIKVDSMKPKSHLVIEDGRQDFKKGQNFKFRPRKIPYDSIIIDGHSGYVSLQAFHWLSKNKIPVHILNFEGSLISSILPPIPIKADLRIAQIEASKNLDMKFKIAYELVKAKLQRTHDVLKWLRERHDIEKNIQKVEKESQKFSKVKTVKDLRNVEGRVALRYWQTFQAVLPETFDFHGRITKKHQYNASDPVNLVLNYAYGVLEGECRKAVNIIGLEPSVGFLHDFACYQTKQSLVYDLQEPFRWICEVASLEAFESGLLDLKDFYFMGDDYRYHIDFEAKHRFLELLRERFNSGVKYKGKHWKWDTVILKKTEELGKFLLDKSESLDLSEPVPRILRSDSLEMRKRILELSQKQAKELGISRSTLHHLKKKVKEDKPFKVYQKVATKIESS